MSIDIKNMWHVETTNFNNRVSLFQPHDESRVAVIEHYFMSKSDCKDLENKILVSLNNHDKLIEALKNVLAISFPRHMEHVEKFEAAKELLKQIEDI